MSMSWGLSIRSCRFASSHSAEVTAHSPVSRTQLVSSFYFTNSEEKVKEMEFALDVEKLSSTRLHNELAQHPQDTDPEKKEEKKRGERGGPDGK